MAKVKCSMVMSPNGYIARVDGDVSWIASVNWTDFLADAQNCNNIVVGSETFEQVMRLSDELNFNSVQAEHKVVVSSREDFGFPEGYYVVRSPQEAVDYLSQQGTEVILVAGGGKLCASFAEAGLIDILEIIVEPHVIGEGRQLLPPGNFEFDLELLEINKFSQNRAQLLYKVVK